MTESEIGGALVILTGGKAVGKTTVASEIKKLDPTFERIVTYTSRPPRANETDGVHYHFLSPEDFIQRETAGFFFEWVEYAGHLKGTSNDSLEYVVQGRNRLWIIDPSRAVRIKNELPTEVLKRTFVFLITTPDQETQLERFRADLHRNLNPHELKSFAKSINEDAEYLTQTDKFDGVILNKDGNAHQSAKQILSIIRGSF